MMPRPSQFGRRAKFRSVPSWMASTVRWLRIRWTASPVRFQDVLHRNRTLLRLLDETVIAVNSLPVVFAVPHIARPG